MNNKNKLIWIAALLEGEGAFTQDVSARVQLGMTDKDVVEKYCSYLRDLGFEFNGNILQRDYNKKKNIKHSISYHFKLSSINAIKLMKLILPYMGLRRSNRIKMIIGDYYAKR